MKNDIIFKRAGKNDYMGMAWYGAYDQNGNKIMVQGYHLKYKAKNQVHAMKIHDLTN